MRLYSNLLRQFRKYTHNYSTATSPVLEQLQNRRLIRVSGNDASNLLQGLITNDMQHLSQKTGSMYAMFLNNKGRVLYDTIIYRLPKENTYMLEIDKEVLDAVRKHLIIYRLRKKVDVVSVGDELKVWVYFNPNLKSSFKNPQATDGGVVPCSTLGETAPDNNLVIKKTGSSEILTFRDPRLSLLGSRILTPASCESELEKLFNAKKDTKYKQFRYQLGVGEGIEELPPGNCFPLEANCDYLHGVSFHKGCYIGQELTARTYHTGVIRKRLMPLLFLTNFEKFPAQDEPIKAGEKSIGKLRGYDQNSGIGLLRIQQALEAKEILIGDTSAKTFKPDWWPIEAVKEKISKNKS